MTQTLNELLGNLVIEDELANQYKAEIERELNASSNDTKNTVPVKSSFQWTVVVVNNKSQYGFHCSVSGGKGAIAVLTGVVEGTASMKTECSIVIDNKPTQCERRETWEKLSTLDVCEATELVIENVKQACLAYIGFFVDHVKESRA